MADTVSYIKLQQLVKEQNQANRSKYYTHFLNKSLIVIIFLVIIPSFPSQAPEFINQTLLNRSWELLHLVFFGIAVSYGLFSRKNDESEKENNNHNQPKCDNVQSIVSRFLQVSSVFDDDADDLSGCDESKVQTWSNQYSRNEPPVIVAKERAVVDEQRGFGSRIAEKPLLLPVRSLKSRVLDANNVETSRDISANSRSFRRSYCGSSSKKFSDEGLGGFKQDPLAEELNENSVVFPSPIPWRARSGRMEVKEDVQSENRLESLSFRSQNTRLSRSSSMSSSPKLSHSQPLSPPKKLSPPSSSMEAQSKSAEDLVRKKIIYMSPPPPPPPPPPPMNYKSSSLKPSYSSLVNDLPLNITSEPNGLHGNRGDAFMGKQRDCCVDGFSNGKSVRTTRKDGEIENAINGSPVRFDHTTMFRAEKQISPTFKKFPQEEEKQEFVETGDDESESEDEEVDETCFVPSTIQTSPNDEEESSPSSGTDGASDVDKKADEFIAKVREQIRLQRIDSIKRSSGQLKRDSTR